MLLPLYRWPKKLALLPGFLLLAACSSPKEDSARDVILITVDTLRADALGFAGNSRVKTPTLDRLAQSGRIFDNAHAHSTVTLPSHANILTGMYPFRHGVRDNLGYTLPEDQTTLAELLGDGGFTTAAFVAAVPLIAETGLDQGFDVYDDALPKVNDANPFLMAHRPGDEVVGAAVDWWNQNADQRRFLWVHLFEPHAPYQPAEPFRAEYQKKPYLGEVATADSYLSALIDPIVANDASPDTLIVFTSDHGESLGEHGEITHGFFAYESTLKVPLVLWGPKVISGRDPRAARHVDILTTVLAATGVSGGSTTDGVSLLEPAVAQDSKAVTYFESLTPNLTRGWAPLRGLIKDGQKAIEMPVPELYDLAQDTAEEHNLASQKAPEYRSLVSDLPDAATSRPNRGPVSSEVELQLEALGYLGGSAPAKTSYGVEDDLKNLVHLDRKLMRTHMLFSKADFSKSAAMAAELLQERSDLVKAREYLAFSLLHLGRPSEAIAIMKEALVAGLARPSIVNQLALSLTRMGQADEAVAILEESIQDGKPPSSATLNALALALVGAERAEEAIPVAQRVLANEPENAPAYETLAVAAQALGRWEDARDYGRRATELDDQRADAWSNLGVALINLEDARSAIAAWSRAVEIAPNHVDALFNLGLTAGEIGDDDQARTALTHFLAMAPPDGYEQQIQAANEMLARLN